MIEYFWETEYPFGEFLKSIFPTYRRKFSLSGSGIYNLITCNGNLYEIKYKQAKQFVTEDFCTTKDQGKNEILSELCQYFENNSTKYTTNSGKFITFKTDSNFIAKIEIIKKLREPS